MLEEGTRGHTLLFSKFASASVLTAGQSDPDLAEAHIAFGQPDPQDCLSNPRLKWVEVSSAGYTRYDTPEFLGAFGGRGSAFTNACGVFADPCAQHVLAMMLAFARQLLPSFGDQLTDHSWHYAERRYHSRLLTGQTVLMLGFGSIGRRLAQLLAPFDMRLLALRRSVPQTPAAEDASLAQPDHVPPSSFEMRLAALRRTVDSESQVQVITRAELPNFLPEADHIVNILPAHASTDYLVNADFLAACRADARFYNVGRGTTVDQQALMEALRENRLGAAYLDVMEPEPLPVDHALWTTPNCYITPHTAGGRHDQDETLVRHFLQNFAAFQSGAPMRDRVV
jgi:phosphoglycerate dehydrogenase-like enzyme